MTERLVAAVRIEAAQWTQPGAKEARAREQLGVGPVAYYALVGEALDHPEVEAVEPVAVRRLRRLRDARRGVRSAGRLRGL